MNKKERRAQLRWILSNKVKIVIPFKYDLNDVYFVFILCVKN